MSLTICKWNIPHTHEQICRTVLEYSLVGVWHLNVLHVLKKKHHFWSRWCGFWLNRYVWEKYRVYPKPQTGAIFCWLIKEVVVLNSCIIAYFLFTNYDLKTKTWRLTKVCLLPILCRRKQLLLNQVEAILESKVGEMKIQTRTKMCCSFNVENQKIFSCYLNSSIFIVLISWFPHSIYSVCSKTRKIDAK